MSLRAEKRRQEREQAKKIRRYLRPPMYIGNKSTEELAADLGLKKEELEEWTEMRSRELEELYQKRYNALVDEYNESLKKGNEQYNRNLRQFEKDLKKEFSEREEAMITAFNRKLLESENYICLINILIAIMTVHNTWGYTKAIGRYLDNWNETNDELKKTGARKMLEKVNEDFGLDLAFDSFEIEEFIKKCEKKNITEVEEYLGIKKPGLSDLKTEGCFPSEEPGQRQQKRQKKPQKAAGSLQ